MNMNMKTIICLTMIVYSLLFTYSHANVSNDDNKNDLCERVREFIDGQTRPSRTAILRNVFLWPDAIVPFEIDKRLGRYKKYIYHAMNEFHEHSCIRFERRKKSDIAYIRFINDDHSDIGRNDTHPNIISLGPGCYHKATIVHEIGHALGFVHEHQRSDRDEHIMIHIDKVEGDHESKRQQFTKNGHNEDCSLTEYDTHSVMHYGEDAFAKDGDVTISTDKKGAATLTSPMEKYGLSKLDIFAVNVLYCEKLNA